ncbi:MAG: DUF11 domain-containing protein [gamma proteobacterium endosymbiont of Lamellibrachia anaximandri]|nr:DUF11 domain-containing protein [gamma proteobacterium endosymbiont of Lamellibrachia anaximandri]
MKSGKLVWITDFTHLFSFRARFGLPWKNLTPWLLSSLLLAPISAALYAAEGDTTRVSVDSSGAEANGESLNSGISSDGRFIAFESVAGNLVPNDNNSTNDIFVQDRDSGQTTRVSVDSSGVESNGWSLSSAISDDGRYVTFDSSATNLVTADTNNARDIFVHDRTTGVTTRVSLDSSGIEGGSHSITPAISSTGQFVAFASYADNLVLDDTNGRIDIFVHDRDTGETTRVSMDSVGEQSNRDSALPSLSADGRYVVFESDASNLVLNDSNNTRDVFVHDRDTGETARVSVNSSGMEGSDFSSSPAISGDGRFVTFQSHAANLVTGDTNGTTDIFVHDRVSHETTRVSVDSSGTPASFLSFTPDISADGRYVAFSSIDPNLVAGDFNSVMDIFVHDRNTGQTSMVSVRSSGAQGDASSTNPAISADGTHVVFESEARLVFDDFNGVTDIFVNEYVDPIVVPPPPTDADMSVTLSDGSDPVDAGSNVSFSVTATNSGPADATNVMLSVDLPDNVTFISSHAVCSESTSIVSCALGDITSGGGSQISILVTVPFTAGILTTTAEVTADQVDLTAANNSVSETTFVILPDIEIIDSTLPVDDLTILFGTGRIGTTTDEIVTIINNSLTMPVTISVTPNSLEAPFQVLDPNGCDGAPLAAGSSCILTVQYAPTVTGDASDTLILGIGADSVDVAVRGTAVENVADLAISKTADILEVNPGVPGDDMTTFTLTVTNHGPDAANVVVTDRLPAGMEIPAGLSATASIGSYDETTGEWSVGIMDATQPPATETLEIPVQVVSSEHCITNTATVAMAPGETSVDTVNSNNSDSQLISASPGCADLAVSGRATDDFYFEDDDSCLDVFVEISVTNHGPATATGVRIKRNNANDAAAMFDPEPPWLACRVGVISPIESTEIDLETLAPGETKSARVISIAKLKTSGSNILMSTKYRVESDSSDPDLTNNNYAIVTTILRSGGDGLSNSSGIPCFIATAAYGSPMAAEVGLLREFRDQILLPNALGSSLVDAYYASSPPLAALISEHESLQTITRALLKPVIWWAGLTLSSPVFGWLLLICLGIGALFSMVIVAQRLSRVMIGKSSMPFG